MTALGAISHPAKFSEAILAVAERYLHDGWRVLDPFAGTGRVHWLVDRAGLFSPRVETVGIELEPEWATMHPRTRQGNALALPFEDASFDAIVTSPTFGNRMADHHEARDTSRRMTYRHVLGRELSPDNSGGLQWGTAYREFHAKAWTEAARVLRPGGRFILNIKDHIRDHKVMAVTAWHLEALAGLGFSLVASEKVQAPGMAFGENHDARVDHETVAVLDLVSGPHSLTVARQAEVSVARPTTVTDGPPCLICGEKVVVSCSKTEPVHHACRWRKERSA